MMVSELIRSSESLMKIMDDNKIEPYMAKYIEMLSDYDRLIGEGHKKTYVVNYLSEQYELSDRKIYRIIRKMHKTVVF